MLQVEGNTKNPKSEVTTGVMDYNENNLPTNKPMLPRPEFYPHDVFSDLTTDEHLDIIEGLLKDILKKLDKDSNKLA